MAKKTSPWLYIGCGCVALVGLAVVAVGAAFFMGASFFKGYVEDMKDPATRTERVQEILGTERLPEGYYARMYFSIPWPANLDMVLLSDGPEPEQGAFDQDFEGLDSTAVGDHVFVFFAVRGNPDKDLDEVFKGRRKSGEVQFDMGSSFHSREELSRGEIDFDSQKLAYVAHRGDFDTEDGQRIAGIYAQLRATCPDRSRTRLAVWFERLPEGASEEAPPDLPGTPADEETLKDFMSHFNLCVK
jgi:hypothetical protein